MFSQRGLTVIPVFWIRISLTPPRTFICDQILPDRCRHERTEFQWERWISKAHRASNPET